MSKLPRVPLAGMCSQHLRPEGVRRSHDDSVYCFAPQYGCSNCTPRISNCSRCVSNCISRFSSCNPCVSHIRMHPTQVSRVSRDFRICYACKQPGHIARFCPTVRQTVRPYDQRSDYAQQPPHPKYTKSPKRIQRDFERMRAFNAHKALMANLPFASVSTEELRQFFPKFTNDSHPRVLTMQMNEITTDTLNLKLQFYAASKNLENKMSNLQHNNTTLKAERKDLKRQLQSKDQEIFDLKWDLANSKHECTFKTKSNDALRQSLEQYKVCIEELEETIKKNENSTELRTSQGHENSVQVTQGHRNRVNVIQSQENSAHPEQIPGLFMARRPRRQGYAYRRNRYPKQ